MLESEIETYLVERVKAAGGEVRKVKWIGRHGAPDRLVLLPARDDTASRPDSCDDPFALTVGPHQYFVELKATGKKPNAHQRREIERLEKFGCRVLVINCKEGVDAMIDEGGLLNV